MALNPPEESPHFTIKKKKETTHDPSIGNSTPMNLEPSYQCIATSLRSQGNSQHPVATQSSPFVPSAFHYGSDQRVASALYPWAPTARGWGEGDAILFSAYVLFQ